MSKPSFAQVIKNPGFKFLWANQVLIQLAYNSVNLALIIWVFLLTGTNLSVAALMLTIIIPTILFSLLFGVLVDISDRRKVIILTDGLLAIIFFGFVLSKDTYGVILFLSLILNSVYQFFIPAEGSSIPMVVPKKELLLANSLFQLTLFGSILIGYTLAGPVINFFSINSLFFMAGVLALVGMLISFRLPPLISPNGKEEKKLVKSLTKMDFAPALRLIFGQINQTFAFIRGKLPVAVAIGVLAGVQGVVGTLAVLTPAYMERVLKISATDASYIVMFPLGLGMVVGALLVGRLGVGIPKRSLVTKAIIMAGILLLLISLAPVLGRAFNTLDLGERLIRVRPFFHAPSLSFFLGVFAFFLGVSTVAVIAPSQTVLQEYAPEGGRGKIFAVLGLLMALFASIPVVLAGALADIFGVLPVLGALGLFILTLGLLGYRPALFLAKDHLPYRWRQFLGLGHWMKAYKLHK